ncbi:hypothetical protein OG948_56535 (plasmid) [Embleya sp. NBC_00888]|uniref:hypothetical protein n=1 Tax=Embleya sp. NBC_00888 TaxID=2975960 RepID=UPI002F9084F8|nr:hypothetical protein OG948_56535 [Embleya sp. NBC_00888]
MAGDQDGFRSELADAGLPFVMALKPGHGAWSYKDAFRPSDATREPTSRTIKDKFLE